MLYNVCRYISIVLHIAKHSYKYSACEYFKGEHETREKNDAAYLANAFYILIPKAVKKRENLHREKSCCSLFRFCFFFLYIYVSVWNIFIK